MPQTAESPSRPSLNAANKLLALLQEAGYQVEEFEVEIKAIPKTHDFGESYRSCKRQQTGRNHKSKQGKRRNRDGSDRTVTGQQTSRKSKPEHETGNC
jgi:hypothetical protein